MLERQRKRKRKLSIKFKRYFKLQMPKRNSLLV